MDKLSKIPVEFLLKKSREECGALKSYIQELEDTIKKKDEIISKQQKKIKEVQKIKRFNSVQVQVDNHITQILGIKNKTIPKLPKQKQNKRKVNLYKRMTKCYNAWYSGCKLLIPLMDELVHPKKYEAPEPSSETST